MSEISRAIKAKLPRDNSSVRDLFHACGLRLTKQREVIFEALAGSTSHPTADELYRQVHQDFGGMSLATVYNTLDALTAAGLCLRIPTRGAADRYDATTGEHVHVALPDGRLIDLPERLSAEILASIPVDLVEAAERHSQTRVRGVSVHLLANSSPDPT
ncbi:MAG: transcriptional repressor [Planctomycetota bacterium]